MAAMMEEAFYGNGQKQVKRKCLKGPKSNNNLSLHPCSITDSKATGIKSELLLG